MARLSTGLAKAYPSIGLARGRVKADQVPPYIRVDKIELRETEAV